MTPTQKSYGEMTPAERTEKRIRENRSIDEKIANTPKVETKSNKKKNESHQYGEGPGTFTIRRMRTK